MPFDPERPSDQHLKWGLWYVNHKMQILAAGTTLLVLFVLGFGGYALYGFTKLYLVEFGSFRRAVNQAPDTLVNPEALGNPQPLTARNVQTFAAGTGKVDAIGLVRNVNAQYGATFSYRFVGDGFAGTPRPGFVLPGEEKYLAQLGLDTAQLTGGRLEISNVSWRRFDTHLAPDYPTYARERLAVTTEDIKLLVPQSPGGPTRVQFTTTNSGAFGLWNVRYIVLLQRGTAVVGVNTIEADSLQSAETRPLTVTWFESVPAGNKVLIQPEVNILDQGVFMQAP